MKSGESSPLSSIRKRLRLWLSGVLLAFEHAGDYAGIALWARSVGVEDEQSPGKRIIAGLKTLLQDERAGHMPSWLADRSEHITYAASNMTGARRHLAQRSWHSSYDRD